MSDPDILIEKRVRELKSKGMNAIEVQKALREDGIRVPWIMIRKIYSKLLSE